MFEKLRFAWRESRKLVFVPHEIERMRAEISRGQAATEALLLDLALLSAHERERLPINNQEIELVTKHPVAFSSADHQFPRGAALDTTRAVPFVRYCTELFGKLPTYLDLGCSGGGVVLDFILRGSLAIGLEGSDFSKRHLRSAWRVIPSNLFTCDICSPYVLRRHGAQDSFKFDVVGAWEVLEHIPEALLPGMLRNIVNHMHQDSYFMGSIATFPDEDRRKGIVWHVTLKPREWWMERFREAGLEPAALEFDPLDMPRGSGNGPFDWSAVASPHLGFHVIMKKAVVAKPAGG